MKEGEKRERKIRSREKERARMGERQIKKTDKKKEKIERKARELKHSFLKNNHQKRDEQTKGK